MDETLSRVKELITTGTSHQHVAVNVDKIVKAARDPALRRLIGECSLVSVDGMPVVWASRLLGCRLKERVAGIDLFVRLLGEAEKMGWGVYLLGAREEVLARCIDQLRSSYGALRIVGWHHGYFERKDEQFVVDDIAQAQPTLLFVAISSPRKEEFIARWRNVMRVPFAMGVGGSFDIVGGHTRRAPIWMQRMGFEWAYRCLQEPRRMIKRYFVDDALFFWLLLRAVAHRMVSRQTAVD